MKKKLLSVFLAAALAFVNVPSGNVYADSQKQTDTEDRTYILSGGGYSRKHPLTV